MECKAMPSPLTISRAVPTLPRLHPRCYVVGKLNSATVFAAVYPFKRLPIMQETACLSFDVSIRQDAVFYRR